MIEKIKAILNSVRFWSFTFGEIGLWLGYIAKNGFDLASLLTLLGSILVTAAGVGTIDKFSNKETT
jgi:hypothetical protein